MRLCCVPRDGEHLGCLLPRGPLSIRVATRGQMVRLRGHSARRVRTLEW